MATEWGSLIEPVARALLGEPNRAASSPTELRFGTHGSLSIDLAKGTFYDHEAKTGGGTLALITAQTGLSGRDAVEWARGQGLPVEDDRPGNGARQPATLGDIVATYDYTDESGTLLFQVVRFEPKTFRQRQRVNGEWSWSVKGVRQVPYRLTDLLEAIANDHVVFIVEGEKDVENLRRIGVPATTNAGGVGKWRAELNSFFYDADVVVIADNDPQARRPDGSPRFHPDGRPVRPGQDHAQAVAREVASAARRVRVLDLKTIWPDCPDKGDVSDWIEAGEGDASRLYEVVEQLAEWSPPVVEQPPPISEPPPVGEDAPPLPPIQSKAEFIRGFVPLDYLIDGMLQRRFIYSLTGQTGHAKTAVALLLAQLVAAADPNTTLGRHKVNQGRVVYFVGENPDDVRMRVMGTNSIRKDDPARDNIWFIPGVFDVAQMIPILAAETKQHGEISLIVVDTSAAYFLGDEEMSNTQMGAYARVLRRLTTLPGGPTVLVLCHPIKHAQDASQLLPRGGGAYLAEMDGNLTLWRTDDLAVLDHAAKFRGPGFQAITFRIERIDRAPGLVDTKGRSIPTVHAVPMTQTEEDAATDTTRTKEDQVLVAMLGTPDGGSLAAWAEKIGWENARGEPDKKTVENCINRLKNNKPLLIRKNRNQWELTEEGKTQARKASSRFANERNAAAQKTLL